MKVPANQILNNPRYSKAFKNVDVSKNSNIDLLNIICSKRVAEYITTELFYKFASEKLREEWLYDIFYFIGFKLQSHIPSSINNKNIYIKLILDVVESLEKEKSKIKAKDIIETYLLRYNNFKDVVGVSFLGISELEIEINTIENIWNLFRTIEFIFQNDNFEITDCDIIKDKRKNILQWFDNIIKNLKNDYKNLKNNNTEYTQLRKITDDINKYKQLKKLRPQPLSLVILENRFDVSAHVSVIDILENEEREKRNSIT